VFYFLLGCYILVSERTILIGPVGYGVLGSVTLNWECLVAAEPRQLVDLDISNARDY